jgi:predicted nucleic acid-binding protein
MRALLDVNVLIALLDPDHSLHARATGWFASHARSGWYSGTGFLTGPYETR